mmetsp:Transcript_170/g.237  ORF Transcript_170/g.237 Transcript_170/m.237 type:complete len:325 (-) Transcript_170:223-1197(-)
MKEQSFDEKVKKAFPFPVILISGDNVESDNGATSHILPPSEGRENLTQTLLSALKKDSSLSWKKCMQQCNTEKPKLWSTRPFKLTQECRLYNEGGGVKRALLVGISYKDPKSKAHKNVYAMKDYLLTQGFEEKNINILMDNEKEMNPTKIGIFRELSRLVKKCHRGEDDKGVLVDSAFVYVCGHGAYLDDIKQNALYPMDFYQSGGIIEEDILKKLLFTIECPLYMVMDLVNSGAGIELPYSFSPNVPSATNSDELERTAAYAIGNVVALAAFVAVAGGVAAASEAGCCDACCMGEGGDSSGGGGGGGCTDGLFDHCDQCCSIS